LGLYREVLLTVGDFGVHRVGLERSISGLFLHYDARAYVTAEDRQLFDAGTVKRKGEIKATLNGQTGTHMKFSREWVGMYSAWSIGFVLEK
jgi:hypothetical protein